jgi:two-component system, response regulator / RNA-binding antiterminator
MLRIMLVDDTTERAFYLSLVLGRLGYDVVAEISDPHQLHDEVLRLSPDAIIVDTDSPSRDTLENLCAITESCPRPIVMFASDPARESIRQAVRAGVSAYVVDGLAPERITPILDTAVARFEAFQAMKNELDSVKAKLSGRKIVEKAKGILMKTAKLTEDQAYRALRKQAMDRKLQIVEVARQVIAVSELMA